MKKKWNDDVDSAPKDGTLILACLDGPWQEEWEQWKAPRTISYRAFHPNTPGKKLWRDCRGSPVDFTYWMLLSDLPKLPTNNG